MDNGIAIAAALIVGVTLGLLGAGGSILTVPSLIFLLGVAPKPAMAMALLVVALTSAAAATLHAREGHVRPLVALPFALASLPGAYLGGRLSLRLADRTLLYGFAFFMIAAAIALLARRERPPATGAKSASHRRLRIALAVGWGAVVGVITGVLGAGGGFLIVPALAALTGLPLRDAIGTSLLVITFNALTGLVARADPSLIEPRLTAIFSVIAVAGAVVGHRLGRRLPVAVLRQVFAVLVIGVAAVMLARGNVANRPASGATVARPR